MVAAVASHLENNGGVLVEPLPALATMLQLNDSRWFGYDVDKAFTRLRYIGNWIHNGDVQHLYFPVNISDAHWAVFHVDGIKQTISYADSLNWEMPLTFINLIRRWLNHHRLPPFNK